VSSNSTASEFAQAVGEAEVLAQKEEKEQATKKLIVKLSEAERLRLQQLINKGKSPAKIALKARILLKADASEAGDNWSDGQIIEALDTNASMVFRTRRQFSKEGLEAVLRRKQPAAGSEGAVSIRKCIVRLSTEERDHLEALINTGKSSAKTLLKARILLKADVSAAGDGWTDRQIVEALNTNHWMVERVRRQLVEEGFDAVLKRKQRETPARPRIFDGEKEARLIQLACSTPPEGRKSWTLRLLEDKVVELGVVERASDNTIGRVLKKTNLNPIARNNGSSRRRPTARS
jgi:hypothetical protein